MNDIDDKRKRILSIIFGILLITFGISIPFVGVSIAAKYKEIFNIPSIILLLLVIWIVSVFSLVLGLILPRTTNDTFGDEEDGDDE